MTQNTESVVRDLIHKGAKSVIRGVLNNAYPIRVATISGQDIILNQGGVTLVVGEVLNVYSAGKTVKETYSGESLGRMESLIGSIKIHRVAPKMSYAHLLSGDALLITIGSICRSLNDVSAQTDSDIGRPSTIRFTESGGVKLPFDK